MLTQQVMQCIITHMQRKNLVKGVGVRANTVHKS